MVFVIITAAGSGSRFGAQVPKQFCLLDGRPVLCHTIDAFRHAIGDSDIILTLSADTLDLWQKLCEEHKFISPQIVIGGKTRFHSVKNGIDALKNKVKDTDIIMVHDGARPFVNAEMCQRLSSAASEQYAAIPVVAVTDSLRQIEAEGVNHTVDRSMFRAVQTPQAFRADVLIKAYDITFSPEFTDDASVVETAGFSITLVEGAASNIKITHPSDLEIAHVLMHKNNDKIIAKKS